MHNSNKKNGKEEGPEPIDTGNDSGPVINDGTQANSHDGSITSFKSTENAASPIEVELATPAEDDDIKADPSFGAGRQLGWKRYLGVIYTLCALNMSALAANILKLLEKVNPITINLYYFLMAIPLTAPFLFYRRYKVKKPLMKNVLPMKEHKVVFLLLWLRANFTLILIFSFIWSIRYIEVADSRTIFASSVITVNIFGCLFFKEKFGIVTAIVSFIALCGIIVMTKPPFITGGNEFSKETLIGVSLALVCMLGSSVNMLVLRFLKIYHGILNISLYIYGALALLPFAIGFDAFVIRNGSHPEWKDILLICGYGILAVSNNLLIVLALQIEEAGTVALVRTCEVIFTFMWQWILLNKMPDWISILGASLVMTGVVVVGVRKWIESKDEDNPIRKRLRWLLL